MIWLGPMIGSTGVAVFGMALFLSDEKLIGGLVAAFGALALSVASTVVVRPFLQLE